jgi:hypothetical protein
LTAAAARAAPNVSLYDATTRGAVTACQKPAQPRPALFQNRVESGMRTMSER